MLLELELFVPQKNRKRIDDLTEYLEQVNIGAGGTLIQAKEDEYSHLQDEIYKTVTMLYQTRETAVAAKKNFAENLANIAHQLKTPITAAFCRCSLWKKKFRGLRRTGKAAVETIKPSGRISAYAFQN